MAAHFLRSSALVPVAFCLAFPVLLFVEERWTARAFQIVLVLGAINWISDAFSIARDRIAAGEPFVRMAVILASVALFTAGSALVFYLPAMKRRYKLNGKPDEIKRS